MDDKKTTSRSGPIAQRGLQRPSRRPRRTQSRPEYETALAWQCRVAGLVEPLREYRVCEGRRFRFDLAWPVQRVALEIDGGVWISGRHSRGAGITSDCEKFSLAAIHGWRVLRVTGAMVRSGKALLFLRAALPVDARVAAPAAEAIPPHVRTDRAGLVLPAQPVSP